MAVENTALGKNRAQSKMAKMQRTLAQSEEAQNIVNRARKNAIATNNYYR